MGLTSYRAGKIPYNIEYNFGRYAAALARLEKKTMTLDWEITRRHRKEVLPLRNSPSVIGTLGLLVRVF